MIVDVAVVGKRLHLYTEYNASLVSVLKYLKARWDSEGRFWYIGLEGFGFLDERGIVKKFEPLLSFCRNGIKEKLVSELSRFVREGRSEVGKKVEADIRVPDGLQLYGFQEDGIKMMLGKGGRVLLADEMGLGKTVQVVGYINVLLEREKVFPLVVVCPAVMKMVWKREIEKWCIKRDVRVQVVQGRSDELRDADVYVLNYDILSEYVDRFDEVRGLVLDECHYIKNRSAVRTRSVYALYKKYKPRHVLALSGTPLLNRPVELWTTLNLLKPSVFGNFWTFVMRYCGAYKSQWGWQFNGATNIEELARLLKQTVMIRREKKDVLKDLPDKMRVIVPLQTDGDKQLRELEHRVKKIIEELDSLVEQIEVKRKEGNVEDVKKLNKRLRAVWSGSIGEIEEYRLKAVRVKLPFMFEFIDSCIEQGENLVVFVYHREIWQEVMKRYKDIAVGIIGGDSVKDRDEVVKRFQSDDKVKIFVGSIRACGEGITLTKASKAVFLEYDWTPARMLQAEDRLHRIGQKDTVSSYWFVLENSIDEYFVKKIVDKMKIVEKVLDVKDREEFILFDFLA